ncbi:hypothetical protein Phi10:1_gp016 [Cellulophaga phage phi10:1]|uniref:Uncharacterized protein n=1 Tax=Cellulophaga phage phi10:1 TaxID=1327981 RepID=S0A1I9_9CAUD|nr:hypothetical protein Phi10:1_gp016 [Cellulophaga phage phi10:1]AGO48357.1 hypothetical protein Phi10:1_gp016 [Cellulophaga phage phi10:1]
MIERNIDCRKHRKSTHIASADLDSMELENKKLIFTIEDARYETGVDVSGNKTDGYFVKFKGQKKEMVLNSVNRKTLADLAKIKGFEGAERYNIGNWIGFTIELFVDRKVKMMGSIVDGIRVRPAFPILEKPELTPEHKRWEDAKKAVKAGKLESVTSKYKLSEENLTLIQA